MAFVAVLVRVTPACTVLPTRERKADMDKVRLEIDLPTTTPHSPWLEAPSSACEAVVVMGLQRELNQVVSLVPVWVWVDYVSVSHVHFGWQSRVLVASLFSRRELSCDRGFDAMLLAPCKCLI